MTTCPICAIRMKRRQMEDVALRKLANSYDYPQRFRLSIALLRQALIMAFGKETK
jgi:hypothetical protein